MSTRTNRNAYREGAVAEKIERLLPVVEAHVAMELGRAGTFHPKTDVADARVLLVNAEATLKGERVIIHFQDRSGRAHSKETYVLWNKVAMLAELPESRYPSISTVRALVARLRRRVQDLEAGLTGEALIKQVAGAA